MIKGFGIRFNVFQKDLFDAFLILVGEKGDKGVLDIKGLGVTFDGAPIAFVRISKGSILFVTDNDEYYGFNSENIKDVCRLYDDIVEVLS